MLPASVTCCTLWIGGPMGRLERACLRSVMRQGHPVVIYAYDPVEGAPDGVVFAPAASVLPRKAIIRHASGSYALFANHFRYKLQALGLGVWIDTDVYGVGPLDFDAPYVFGRQDSLLLNNAVLRLPRDSPMLYPLLKPFRGPFIPPWLTEADREPVRERLERTGRTGIELMPWGTMGPHALTATARHFRLMRHAQRRSVFYPAHWKQAEWILDPATPLEAIVKPWTRAIHLWNERIKPFKDAPAPAGSFLERLHQEGG